MHNIYVMTQLIMDPSFYIASHICCQPYNIVKGAKKKRKQKKEKEKKERTKKQKTKKERTNERKKFGGKKANISWC